MNELTDLLGYVPVSARAQEAVVRRLHEPHRHYHTLDHVLEMWRWHQHHRPASLGDSSADEIVACFCLYHDAIYDAQAIGEANEQASADLWLADSAESVAYPVRMAVDEIIVASADHFRYRAIPHDAVYRWCLDLDLLRLGSAGFTDHGRDIRQEYAHLSDQQWIKLSALFRAKVMAQGQIFICSEFVEVEQQARRNLAQALIQDWQTLGYLP